MRPGLSWPRLERALAVRRRLVVAILVGLTVLFGLSAMQPATPPAVRVLAAAHDLAAGTTLALADVRSLALPAGSVPAGALRPGAPVLGRVVAGPVRRGEPLTDVRLVGPSLLAALARGPDVVAVPIRFADAGVAALLRPGDRVDVLAAPADGASTAGASTAGAGADPALPGPPAARTVAEDVLVVLVAGAPSGAAADPGLDAGSAAPGDGALVVVACSRSVAAVLAAAGAADRLSPALRAPVSGTPSPEPRGESP